MKNAPDYFWNHYIETGIPLTRQLMDRFMKNALGYF
jgi:hypothetical protein